MSDVLEESHRVLFAVDGMTCGACAVRVERKLNKLDGVVASVNYATGVASVEMGSQVKESQVAQAISDAGYSGKLTESVGDKLAGADEGLVRLRRLWVRLFVCFALVIPLADLSVLWAFVPAARIVGWQWIIVVLALPIVFWCAWPIHRTAWQRIRKGSTSMESLISVGVLIAFGWSLWTLINVKAAVQPANIGLWSKFMEGQPIYTEVAVGVTTFVLVGRYLEAKAKVRAFSALKALAGLGVKDVKVRARNGEFLIIPIEQLQVDQVFLCGAGGRIASDGVVVSGSSLMDLSAMTGESEPVLVREGDEVTGGTISLSGVLEVKTTAVGDQTKLAKMVELVALAGEKKAALQKLADKIASVFVPVVFLLSILVFTGWMLSGAGVNKAFACALAVLVIACPCALGLATPTALLVASSRGAQLGIFVKEQQGFETTAKAKVVAFDKTGTLTEGKLAVREVQIFDPKYSKDMVLTFASSIQANHDHPFAKALINAAKPVDAQNIESTPGYGVSGVIENQVVKAGKDEYFSNLEQQIETALSAAKNYGYQYCLVSVDNNVIGLITLSDQIKPSAIEAIKRLKEHGILPVIISGDHEKAVKQVADEVGVETWYASQTPAQKVEVIQKYLGTENKKSTVNHDAVIMVGDGINDAPALAAATLSMAMGRGTDIAHASADVILASSDLNTVNTTIGLAEATVKTIRWNMIWAFGYNIAAIPLAAFGFLNPLIAGAAMAVSSFFVVANSVRLYNYEPK